MEIIVIGNGVAGEAACSAICSRGKGVKCTLISQEPYLFYSPSILARYISKEIKRSKVFLKSLKDYKKQNIKLLLNHRVERIDPFRKTLFLNGREVMYDKLILATGSHPIVPSIEGIEKKGVRAFKSLRDADYLFKARGEKAIIIGSGPVGIELAVALRKRNWEVCLVEVMEWILPNQLSEKGSFIIRRIMESHGIEVLTGEKVLAIEGRSHVKGVVTSRTGRHQGDIVVLATGMQPSIEIARQAGIEIGESGGIRTNDEMETNINDIYACGDCVEAKDPFTLKPKLSLLWPQAERQGRVAGCNSLGEHQSVRWMPDVINLDVFGTFIGAIGESGRSSVHAGAEMLEVCDQQYFHCLSILGGTLLGAQFIGDYEGIGIFVSLIGKNYQEICRKIKYEEDIAGFYWYYSARTFFL